MTHLERVLLLVFFSFYLIPSIFSQSRVVITDDDLQNQTYTWSKENTYVLQKKVVLESGGKLTIEAGTRIEAEVGGGLVIQSGAQIFAEGTASAPIIFTTDQNRPELLTDLVEQKGLWRGLRIKGAVGFNSGILAYVSIRQAGEFLNDLDEAGLVLENVDEATTIHHVEVAASDLDGIKIKGGTVNISNAAVFLATDDGFDWDDGWQGNGLNWFVYLGGPLDGEDNDSYAIEGNGGADQEKSDPKIFNATLIGAICNTDPRYPLDFSNQLGAIRMRNRTKGLIANSVIANFPQKGIRVQDIPGTADSRQEMENGNLTISNNIWWDFGQMENTFSMDGQIVSISTTAEDPTANFLTNHLNNNENVIDGLAISSSIHTNYQYAFAIDPRLNPVVRNKNYPNRDYSNEELFSNLLANRDKGAFADGLWIKGWTMIDVYGVIDEKKLDKTFFKDRELGGQDTLRLQCEDQAWAQDSIRFYDFRFIDIINPPSPGQSTSTDRRGNRRRRATLSSRTASAEENYAFLEEWNYPRMKKNTNSCLGLDKELDIVILYFDTVAPTIHLIPDENGNLSAFAQDCDEASITRIERDTILDAGNMLVTHTFYAEDYSGNQSSLTVTTLLNGATEEWYPDFDGDGFGNPDFPIALPNSVAGFVQNKEDCNDEDANVNPNTMAGDSIFNATYNCSGRVNYDICSDAFDLKMGERARLFFAFSNPSINVTGLGNCGLSNFYRDIWFQFKVPASGAFAIEMHDVSFPLYSIELFQGDCQSMEFIECYEFDDSLVIKDLALDPNATIYGRVRESSNRDNGSINIKLDTAAMEVISSIETVEELLDFEVFPNPSHPHQAISIQIDNIQKRFVDLAVYNLQGQVVHQITQSILPQGNTTYTIANGLLDNGFYFIQLHSAEGILTKKLIVSE